MCRMLGIKNFDYNKHKVLLEEFCELAENGMVLKGDTSGHHDGWGIAFYRDNKPIIHKSGNSVTSEKADFFKILEDTGKTGILIAHLRKSAWKDTNTTRHSHPFAFKNYVLAHNGTIKDYRRLIEQINLESLDPEILRTAVDTEVFLYYILTRQGDDIKTKFQNAAAYIKANNDYSSLNCLFSEGKNLYCYRNFTRAPEYYTLYCSSDIVCSEKISAWLKWELIPPEKLIEL